jgi:hypothetical protein
MRLIQEGNPAGNGKLKLSTCRRTAKNLQPGSDEMRPFPHSRESPVSVPAGLEYVRVDSAAIVAHQEAKLIGAILQLDVDVTRPRMAKSVDQRLPANPVHLIARGKRRLPGALPLRPMR